MKIPLLLMTLATFAATQLHAADAAAAPAATDAASDSMNSLGVDLLAKTGRQDENALLSPYSIQQALAMAYVGAAGATRDEMTQTLHFPKNGTGLDVSFAALRQDLTDIVKDTALIVADSKRGGPREPITLSVANRLYGQKGYDFRTQFLDALKDNYSAPLQQVDFVNDAGPITKLINTWVADQTQSRIRDLIPAGALTKDSRLVLVNAIYFKAAWATEFKAEATKPAPFHVKGGEAHDTAMMNRKGKYGYAQKDGYAAITLPYIGSELQFLILLPDDVNGLPALQSKLTSPMLSDCRRLAPTEVNLSMPKLKLEPAVMKLSDQLKALGMKTAFDDPKGSANFDGIAPRKPDDYLYISEVFHKTFLSLDEHGTEAAAATAVVMMMGMAMVDEPPPKVVQVDHPFIFAIQDCKSGACLFLGRVNDPR